MKIAIVTATYRPQRDGVAAAVHERLKRLSRWGHEARVFCPDYSAAPELYPDWRDYTGRVFPGVTVVNLPSTRFAGLALERNPAPGSYGRVARELRAFRPDLVHADEPERLASGFLRVAGVRYARRAGVPCIGFYHTDYTAYADDHVPRFAVRWVRALGSKLIAAIYNAYDLTLVASGTAPARLDAMGIRNVVRADLNGHEAAAFHAGLRQEGFFERTWGLPDVEDKVRLVFLGRLHPHEGWRFTLDALPSLVQAVDVSRLAVIVAGEGPLRAEIERRGRPLLPHLHFVGRIAPEQVPAFLANGDVHVTASQEEAQEATLSALAAGTPVLGPRAGGLIDRIEDAGNGLLYTPGDAVDFARKLEALVESPSLRAEMGRRARQSVARLGWDETVRNWLEIVQSLIATKSALRSPRLMMAGRAGWRAGP